jgi:predicted hydrolase (HD superfamily)
MTFMDGLISTQITAAGYYKAVDFGKQTFLSGELQFIVIIILLFLKSISMSHKLDRNSFGDPANAGNLMPIEEANGLLNEWVPNEKLRLHMKQVSAVMKAWSIEKENADEQTALKWELAGLLHDADWEKYPDDHCRIIIEELEKRNIDPDVIHCIASHGPGYFGVEPNNTMDKMIYAFDELSGFIHAAALIRPTRYEGLEIKSVLKRLKSPAFAAQVSREDINDAITRINTPLEEIIQFIVDHQKDVN